MSKLPVRPPEDEFARMDEEQLSWESTEHENGATPDEAEPTARQYVETEDEDELRSLIFRTSDVYEELLDVPEWTTPDGRVFQVLLRALTAAERAQYFKNISSGQGKDRQTDLAKGYADIVIMGARHPRTKKLLFKPADRAELLRKNGKAIERIALRMSEISALDPKSVEDLRKN